METDAIRRLDTSQRRALVVHILEQTQSARKVQAESLLCKYISHPEITIIDECSFLGTIEILLLLIWRHISYYCDPEHSSTMQSTPPILKPSFGESRAKQSSTLRASTMRFLTVPDVAAFQKDAALTLGRVIEKIDSIELVRLPCTLTRSKDKC